MQDNFNSFCVKILSSFIVTVIMAIAHDLGKNCLTVMEILGSSLNDIYSVRVKS